MFVTRSVEAQHKDLIHDVAYDFYGRRMVTCSSDQTIKVWDLQEDGEWHCTANWRCHSGSVWRVDWAHPEFGQVIATCSFDNTATVWEETSAPSGQSAISGNSDSRVARATTGTVGPPATSTWVRRSSLVDSRVSVTDVRFAPHHLGLQLATCSQDGVLRIYEAQDVMSLAQWNLQVDLSTKLVASCLAWSRSRADRPLIAVGSSLSSPSETNKVHIYEYNDQDRNWNQIDVTFNISSAVNDLAFAPNPGKSYHCLAVASSDVCIYHLKPLQRSTAATGITNPAKDGSSGGKYNLDKARDLNMESDLKSNESGAAWRVSWNATGTILASSCDDGCVRLWQCNYLQFWKLMCVMRPDSSVPTHNLVQRSDGNPEGENITPYIKMGSVVGRHQAVWN